jgi:hypothetical protein
MPLHRLGIVLWRGTDGSVAVTTYVAGDEGVRVLFATGMRGTVLHYVPGPWEMDLIEFYERKRLEWANQQMVHAFNWVAV